MSRVLAVGLVLACLLPACAVYRMPASKMPGDSPVDIGENTVISYQRSGGIAGLTDHLVIEDDSHCVLQRRNSKLEFDLAPGELEHLHQLFEEASFFTLNSQYLPDSIGADRIMYSITYQTDGKRHTVRTMDGAIPDALISILPQLNSIISDNAN